MHSQARPHPTPSALPRVIGLSVCIVVVMVSGGCSRSRIERAVVSGRVTYQGQPIKLGQIRFAPTRETGGPVSGADIVDGAYSVDIKGGVPVGTHLVKIEAYRDQARVPRTPPPPGVEARPLVVKTQYLPEQFNTRTQLEITIEPGSGKITKDFDLAN